MNEQVVYLGEATRRFLVVYRPPQEPRGRPAVLLAPPFGWEEIAAHRAVRDWAAHLAAHGYPVLRLDLPGTGDSAGGPTDPGTLSGMAGRRRGGCRLGFAPRRRCPPSWGSASGSEGSSSTRRRPGASSTTSCSGRPRAAAERWCASCLRFPRSKRRESSSPARPSRRPCPSGMLAPGGFVLSPETVADLSAVNLATRPLAPETSVLAPRPRRDQARRRSADRRDGSGSRPDRRERQGLLRDARRAGQVTQPRGGVRHGALLARGAARDARARSSPGPAGAPQTELEFGAFTERPFAVVRRPRTSRRHLGRASARARQPLTAVFLNAGAVRRIGPHRLWVDTARRWALRGIPSASPRPGRDRRLRR